MPIWMQAGLYIKKFKQNLELSNDDETHEYFSEIPIAYKEFMDII